MRVKAAQQESKGTAIKAPAQGQSLPSARMSEQRDPAALLLEFQRTHGNHIVQRWLNQIMIQRKCSCSGTCETCRSEDMRQKKNSDTIPQGYAQPNQAGGIRPAHARPSVMTYRAKTTASFGACNDGGLVEEPINFKKDKDTKPWVERIVVNFNGTTTDSDGDMVPTGDLVATYFNNPAKLTAITTSIVGGKASEGLTDKGNHAVTRIEGCGYHHTSVPKAEQITGHKRAGKYFKDVSKATMNFAVFFIEGEGTGNQAIHEGSLSLGSLACVHVGVRDTIRQINYHSVQGKTKVDVSYDASALKDLCCERFKVKRFMVSNPCKGQDSKKCP